MRKLFLFTALSLFVFTGIFGAESMDNQTNKSEQEYSQNSFAGKKSITQAKKIDKKEFREIRREVRKIYKENHKQRTNTSQMLLVGAALLLLGLLLYLIVSAAFIGITVMILGILLLVYGVLKQFF